MLFERRFSHKEPGGPGWTLLPRPSPGDALRQSTASSRQPHRGFPAATAGLTAPRSSPWELGVLLASPCTAGHQRSPCSVCPHSPFRPPAEERAHPGAHSHHSLQPGGARTLPRLERGTSPGPLGQAGGARVALGSRRAALAGRRPPLRRPAPPNGSARAQPPHRTGRGVARQSRRGASPEEGSGGPDQLTCGRRLHGEGGHVGPGGGKRPAVAPAGAFKRDGTSCRRHFPSRPPAIL